MIVKNVIDEDFINYKKPSMFIAFPYCTFKCEKECGIHCCQNSELATSRNIDIPAHTLAVRYAINPITSSIVLGGLEPLDSFNDVTELIIEIRKLSDDKIVIYTGYKEDEVQDKIEMLKHHKNIIVKFGRFVPDDEPRYDEVLGVRLASKNQYAKQIS